MRLRDLATRDGTLDMLFTRSAARSFGWALLLCAFLPQAGQAGAEERSTVVIVQPKKRPAPPADTRRFQHRRGADYSVVFETQRPRPLPPAPQHQEPERLVNRSPDTNAQPVHPQTPYANIRLAARRSASHEPATMAAALGKAPSPSRLPALRRPSASQRHGETQSLSNTPQPLPKTQTVQRLAPVRRRSTQASGSATLETVAPAIHREAKQTWSDQPATTATLAPARQSKPVTQKPTPAANAAGTPSLFDRLLIEAHEAAASASTAKQYTAIIRLCEEAANEEPGVEKEQFAAELAAWSLNRRGQTKLDAGDAEGALDDFDAALDFDPNNWRARHNRGISLAQFGELAEAFDDINRVITEKPRFAKAYCNRATLYVQAGRHTEALDDYERAILLDDTMAQAHIGRGRLCHQEGLLNEALVHFTKAIDEGPKTADLFCSRADLLADMGLYSQALADYARAIELDPKFGHAYRNGAWLLATCPNEKFRDPKNALAGATRALEMGYGDRCVLLDTIAAALASAGYYDEARQAMDKAIGLAPESLQDQYAQRRDLYAEGVPFTTRPLATVQQASFAAE
ncbi:MAG: tetratricopeptide repeat protein [Planctomycetota bacterium]